MSDALLPYRSGPDELAHWLEQRARGRSSAQMRSAGVSAKTQEGSATTASSLGFAGADGELTARGREYALASPEQRKELLRAALETYQPYRHLLETLQRRGERSAGAETEAEWVETWWGAQGYGSSPSNRKEGVAVLGRLAEFVGLARYVVGRRGQPTRLVWQEPAAGGHRSAAPTLPADAPPLSAPLLNAPLLSAPPLLEPATRTAAAESASRGEAGAAGEGKSAEGGARLEARLVLPSGRVAEVRVPAQLAADEKRRLLALVEALITVEEGGAG